jgi:hypothetical protein
VPPEFTGTPGATIVPGTFVRGLRDDAPIGIGGVSTSSDAGPPARDPLRLSDHDKSIIGQARHLAGLSGPAAVRARFGTTAVSYADTAHAYAEALGRATRIIGELLAIIERLAGVTPEAL